MSTDNIGFIGGGNMARALVGGLVSSGYPHEHLFIAEPNAARRDELAPGLPGVTITADNHAVAGRVDSLVLAVKPQAMRDVCTDLAATVQKRRPLVVSVAAGTHSRDIDEWLGGGLAIVRVMPNQPALLLEGASGLYANDRAGAAERNRATEIVSAVGSVVHVDDEGKLDAVTAISGTGPAYFYLLIDMLMRAAEDFGLDPQAAHKLVMDTARGSAALASVSGEPMAAMIEHVRSPGGTTAAAFAVFESADVRGIFARAFTAARDRSRELAAENAS
jgi:pyrroline-5-carboxylate reductase